MIRKNKTKKGNNSPVRKVAAGVFISLSVMALSIVLIAVLISSEVMNEDGFGYYIVLIHLVSTIAGGYMIARHYEGKSLYPCMLLGAIYMVVLLVMSAVFFGGQYQGISATAVVIVTGCMIAAMTSKCGRKRVKSRRSGKRRC